MPFHIYFYKIIQIKDEAIDFFILKLFKLSLLLAIMHVMLKILLHFEIPYHRPF